MKQKSKLQRYKTISEAVNAANWLIITRPYLFDGNYGNFGSFGEYLQWMRFRFVGSLIVNGDVADAGRPPKIDNTEFRIIYINSLTWKEKDAPLKTAVMVHELSEFFLLSQGYVFWPYDAHVVGEFFEHDFRKSHGLPRCEVCPLPRNIIPVMRRFEEDLEKRIGNVGRYDVGLMVHNLLKNEPFYKRL
ncbi:hypothetical protein HYS31_06025 [Candidatus Woesearchaeota archaeon]|nr:hypothetical protein [Candidatus Woesearchaeota archaeon]